MENNQQKAITIITTGGTIEKSYDEFDGSLGNRESIIKTQIIDKLRLPYTRLELFSIFAKDSLQMDDEDREFLAMSIRRQMKKGNPVVVLHGTDTMSDSANYCFEKITENINVPVIFTGAMKPIGFIDSDARQNFTEAIMAAKLLEPGFYISFHNRVFRVPNARKNREKRTFERVEKTI